VDAKGTEDVEGMHGPGDGMTADRENGAAEDGNHEDEEEHAAEEDEYDNNEEQEQEEIQDSEDDLFNR
jgi:hypothetical protein